MQLSDDAMHSMVREWIVDILRSRLPLISVAVQRRAKFEQWLKFELAFACEQHGATDLEVEAPSGESYRSDLAFRYQGVLYHVELKTPNTNWRIPGVRKKSRPITRNIASVEKDARKLVECEGRGLIAFVLFPIPTGSDQWKEYLERISRGLGIALSEEAHCSRVSVPVCDGHFCEVIVCCFPYPVCRDGRV